MNKLTAEVARMDIGHLKSFQANPHVGLSLKEEKYLQALEIALPVLEQAESKRQVTLREAASEIRTLTEESGGYNFEALRAEQDDSHWISCSERMPVQYQSNRYVPLTLLLNERTVAQGGFDDGKFWIDGVVMHNVTRWQPMPLPPSTTPQIDNDVWIEWSGGKCPVDGNANVELKFRDGCLGGRIRKAGGYYWGHSKTSYDSDIIAYRVIENDGREG